MSSRCDACDRHGLEPNQATILKGPSARTIWICDACRDRLESRRCRLCGGMLSDRPHPVVVFGVDSYDVCRRCRSQVVYGEGVAEP